MIFCDRVIAQMVLLRMAFFLIDAYQPDPSSACEASIGLTHGWQTHRTNGWVG